MRKLIVSEFMTIDGVMEDPGGVEGSAGGGWAFKYDRGIEGEKFKLDEVLASGGLVLGRATYENFAAAWPSRTGEFADRMNGMPKYVISTTLRDPQWSNTSVLSGDAAVQVAALKDRPGGNLLLAGSGQLVQAMLDADLVDELRLMVFPVILGAGRRLFGQGGTRSMRLTEARPVGPDGVIILTYKTAR